jgi:hypothetical protein
MALPASFSLLHSELNGFLFAPLGKEENGEPLSVLSALTRMDIDPWAEGARLAKLPTEAAVGALTPLIAFFPEEHRSPAQVRDIALRLAALLPQAAAGARGSAAPPQLRRRGWPLVWLAALAAILALAAMSLRGLIF